MEKDDLDKSIKETPQRPPLPKTISLEEEKKLGKFENLVTTLEHKFRHDGSHFHDKQHLLNITTSFSGLKQKLGKKLEETAIHYQNTHPDSSFGSTLENWSRHLSNAETTDDVKGKFLKKDHNIIAAYNKGKDEVITDTRPDTDILADEVLIKPVVKKDLLVSAVKTSSVEPNLNNLIKSDIDHGNLLITDTEPIVVGDEAILFQQLSQDTNNTDLLTHNSNHLNQDKCHCLIPHGLPLPHFLYAVLESRLAVLVRSVFSYIIGCGYNTSPYDNSDDTSYSNVIKNRIISLLTLIILLLSIIIYCIINPNNGVNTIALELIHVTLKVLSFTNIVSLALTLVSGFILCFVALYWYNVSFGTTCFNLTSTNTQFQSNQRQHYTQSYLLKHDFYNNVLNERTTNTNTMEKIFSETDLTTEALDKRYMRKRNAFRVEMHQIWMNELPYKYDYETYRVQQTHSVLVRLEGCILKLSTPKRNLPKRHLWNEREINAKNLTYLSHRVFDLTGSLIYLEPEDMPKKVYWNKKYPICIRLKSLPLNKYSTQETIHRPKLHSSIQKTSEEMINMNATHPAPQIEIQNASITHEDTDDNSLHNPETLPKDHMMLYLFSRTNRDKQEWFWRLLRSATTVQTMIPPGITDINGMPNPRRHRYSRDDSMLDFERDSTFLQQSWLDNEKNGPTSRPKIDENKIKSTNSKENLASHDHKTVSQLEDATNKLTRLFKKHSHHSSRTPSPDTDGKLNKFIHQTINTTTHDENNNELITDMNEPQNKQQPPQVFSRSRSQSSSQNVKESNSPNTPAGIFFDPTCYQDTQELRFYLSPLIFSNVLDTNIRFPQSYRTIGSHNPKDKKTHDLMDAKKPIVNGNVKSNPDNQNTLSINNNKSNTDLLSPKITTNRKPNDTTTSAFNSTEPASEDVLELQTQILYSNQIHNQLCWLNALVERVTWDIFHRHHMRDHIEAKIKRKLTKVKLPYFIEPLTLKSFETGSALPTLNLASKPWTDERGIWWECLVGYEAPSGPLLLNSNTTTNSNNNNQNNNATSSISTKLGLKFGVNAAKNSTTTENVSIKNLVSKDNPNVASDKDATIKLLGSKANVPDKNTTNNASSSKSTAAKLFHGPSITLSTKINLMKLKQQHGGGTNDTCSAIGKESSVPNYDSSISDDDSITSMNNVDVPLLNNEQQNVVFELQSMRQMRSRKFPAPTLTKDGRKRKRTWAEKGSDSEDTPESSSEGESLPSTPKSGSHHKKITDLTKSPIRPRTSLTLDDINFDRNEKFGFDETSPFVKKPDSPTKKEIAEKITEIHVVNENKGKKILKMVDKLATSKYFQQATDMKYIKKGMVAVSNTPLDLNIQLLRLEGIVVFNLPNPPSDRLWYGFKPNPLLKVSAQPKLGAKFVNISQIIEWIQNTLTKEFDKLLVLPNMDDVIIPIMNSGQINS